MITTGQLKQLGFTPDKKVDNQLSLIKGEMSLIIRKSRAFLMPNKYQEYYNKWTHYNEKYFEVLWLHEVVIPMKTIKFTQMRAIIEWFKKSGDLPNLRKVWEICETREDLLKSNLKEL
jgi:hypothetical protein